MSDDSSDIGAFMAGFVIGGLVGAATALILAPQSGSETRGMIAARGEELRRSGEEQLLAYRDMAEARVGEVRDRMQQSSGGAQERARIVLDEGKSRVSEAIDKGKARLDQLKSELSDPSTDGKESDEESNE